MKSASVWGLVLALTLTGTSQATTWSEPQPVPDPVQKGALINVLAPCEPTQEPSVNDKVRLLLVLAYYYEADLKDFEGALSFRREALEMIEAALQTVLPEGDRREYVSYLTEIRKELP